MSQPSLSAAIQKLEDELGGALFKRDGRTLEATPLGESMRIHLSRIEQAREAASLAASDMVHGKSTVINLGLMCTLSSRRLASAFASFGMEQANSEVLIHDVWESNALELLLSGALDCIIMAHASDLPERFNGQHLTDEPMMLAMHEAHPLAALESISISDLQDQHYVDRLRCEFREIFYEELSAHDVSVQVVLQSEREDLVSESVLSAVGVSIMPQSAAESAGLKTCALTDMAIMRRISIVTVKNRQLDPVVPKFLNHVISAYEGK